MNSLLIQDQLFEQIKNKIGDPKQWVSELADTLALSKPAVYKRINGSTSLSLDDLSVLMKKYNISFDSLIHTDKVTVDFSFPSGEKPINGFIDFLQPIKYFVSSLSMLPEVKIWHATNELHLFYYFMDQNLTNFKMFLHAKTLWNLKGYENIKFSINNFSGSNIIQQEIGEILNNYFETPNIELWNENIMNNTLNQIKYFLVSDYFEFPEEALTLCENMRSLLHHLCKMAETGKKIRPESTTVSTKSEYLLYHNELSYTNNVMLILSPAKNYVFTTYNNPNFMISENERLISYTKNWFERVKRMSIPISLDASQARMLLFKQIEKKIDLTIQEIKNLLERLS